VRRIYRPQLDAETAPSSDKVRNRSAPTSLAEPAPGHAEVSDRHRPQASRFGHAEDLAPEEVQRRADAADAIMQDFKRQIAEKTWR
jgi:hypothetical protein